MNTIQPLFEWTVTATARASILVMVVLLLQRLLQERLSAKGTYALWLPVLVALVLPTQPFLPHWMAWSQSLDDDQTLLVGDRYALGDVASEKLPNISDVTVADPITSESEAPINQSSIVAGDRQMPSLLLPETLQAFEWQLAIMAVWILGSVSVITFLVSGYLVTLRRIQKHAISRNVPDAMVARIDALSAQIGLRSSPRVWLSDCVKSPAVCGLFHPHLLLNPNVLDSLSKEESDFVLRHELMHLRRGDVPMNSFLCVLLAVHWFNPMLWYAFFRVRADRESACDADVLRDEKPPSRIAYGKTLLKLETCLPESRLCLGFVGMFSNKSQLRHRIELIARPVRMGKPAKAFLAAGVLLVALIGISRAAEPLQDSPVPATVVTPLEDKEPWQSDLTEFFDHLQSIARPSTHPDKAYLQDGLLRGTDSWAIPVVQRYADQDTTKSFQGYVDLKPVEGTVQRSMNDALKDRRVQWEFELAHVKVAKVHEGSSDRGRIRRFLELVPRYDDRGDQFSRKFPVTRLSTIRIEIQDDDTYPSQLKAGDRLRLTGTIGDFASNEGVMLGRFTGPIVAYKRGHQAVLLQSTVSIGLQKTTITRTEPTLESSNGKRLEDPESNTSKMVAPDPPALHLITDEEGVVRSAVFNRDEAVSRMIDSGKAREQDFVPSSDLAKHRQLTHLDFPYGSHLTSEDMSSISKLQHITEIDMGYAGVDSEYVTIDGGTHPLGQMKQLEIVRLCKDGIHDQDIRFVAKLTRLHTLELNADNGYDGAPACTDKCAESICQAKRLRHVTIFDGQFTDRFTEKLMRELPELETLQLNSDRFTDETLRLIAKHGKNLKELSISSKQFTREGIQLLESLPKLKRFSIRKKR